VLFSRRWSTLSDKRGVVAFRIGPAPIPVRWRVEAPGYAIEESPTAELHEPAAATLRDVALRIKTSLHVRVHLGEGAEELRGGTLIFCGSEGDHSRRFREHQRFPLRDEVTIELISYGERRLS